MLCGVVTAVGEKFEIVCFVGLAIGIAILDVMLIGSRWQLCL